MKYQENINILDGCRELGQRIGHTLFRVITYSDDRMEIEYESRYNWECLVIRVDSWDEIKRLLQEEPENFKLPEDIVLRKKCTKCFLHERKADLFVKPVTV